MLATADKTAVAFLHFLPEIVRLTNFHLKLLMKGYDVV